MKRLLALGLSLALLVPGMALAENTVEILPTTPPAPVIVLPEENPYAFADLEPYFQEAIAQGYTTDGKFNYELTHFSPEELEKLPEIQAKYDAGERPAESILNKTEDVHAALITLPPEQYEGESWFLILPNRCMTEEELLQVVDAFAQLGQPLNPDALTWHNCMRMPTEETPLRGYAGDEVERLQSIRELFTRGGLRPETPFTRLPSDDGVGCIGLYEEDFNGMNELRFYPARRLTDEELLQLYQFYFGDPPAPADEMAGYEAKLRNLMNTQMGMPLTAKRTGEGLQKANDGNVFGDTRDCYSCTFVEVGGQEREWTGYLDLATGKLLRAYSYADMSWLSGEHQMYSDVRLDPFQQVWADRAKAYIAAMLPEGDANIDRVELRGEATHNMLYAANVRVWMKDGGCYELSFLYAIDNVGYLDYSDAEFIQHLDTYYLETMPRLMMEERGNE
ncbi:MAG: hypothetical protein IJI53_01265 [Clostridia bacterium]|nr:hypothetical protein [Clostridia bacterium]